MRLCVPEGLLFFALALSGIPRAHPSILDWNEQSTLVCIASVNSIKEVKSGTKLPFEYPLPLTTLVASLQVKAVLKGELSDGAILPLELYRLDYESLRKNTPPGTGIIGREVFTSMKVNQSYLVFAERRPATDRYWLVHWGDIRESAIRVGKLSRRVGKRNSALVNVLYQLLGGLSEQDRVIRLQSINSIGDFGVILWDTIPRYYPNEEINNLAADKDSLRALLIKDVLPAVLRLTEGGDEETREPAVVTAARLQAPDVIPLLVSLVESRGDDRHPTTRFSAWTPHDALGGYRSFAPTPRLVLLLKHANREVRRGAAESIRYTCDSRSLPFLLDALDEENPAILYDIVTALAHITGEKPMVSVASFRSKEIQQEYVEYWRNWCVANKAKVDVLRQQITATPH